ncbi:homing endonuclease associated repeat-containing protein [Stratiformator vulcanicus]|nr:hypothetical protein [Stratiformator vulcanicus]
MPCRWTRELLILTLREIAFERGENVTFREFQDAAGVSAGPVTSKCGGWAKLRAAAGLPPQRYSSWKKITDHELLCELHRLTQELKHLPSYEEIDAHGKFGACTYRRRFGRKIDLKRAFRDYLLKCPLREPKHFKEAERTESD